MAATIFTAPSYGVTLTLLPSGGRLNLLLLKLGGFLWLFRPVDYGRSHPLWLLRLSHHRSLQLQCRQPSYPQTSMLYGSPNYHMQSDRMKRPELTRRERDAKTIPRYSAPFHLCYSSSSHGLTVTTWETLSKNCPAESPARISEPQKPWEILTWLLFC